ncbi:LysR family transcriptional regulator [Massilia sp. GCM10023247]|uniref:LysR family transcriptional regulator n=1 Tax=Massilia sp. GCM10023247 TaxID=3252643 RepID=UPI00360F6534
MRLSQLKMFAAVADHGSFSAAAAELGCTQSRISHAIAELERDLGVLLLLRARTGSVPTEAGRRVLAKARQILTLEADLVRSAHEADQLRGRVRIACFRSIGTHLLPHLLEALARAHPALHADIDDSCEERRDVSAALREGRADIGIAQLPLEEGFASLSYVSDDYMLVLPAAAPAGTANGWPDAALPFIKLGCSGADAILARCREAGFAAEAARTLANDTSIAALVARGMGFSILPRLATFPEPEGVRVAALPIPARRQFVVAGLRERMGEPAVRAVVRLLRERPLVARTPAWRAGVLQWD